MVLVGPSGCGKTTALRMLAGLEEITGGEIRIGDRVVNDVDSRDRDVAMVFQNYALYPHMTVFDNIAFGLRARRVAREGDQAAGRADQPGARARRPARAQAAAVVGWATPARCDGPRDRPRAEGVPDGRAALEPGCPPARADARRGRPDPARARRDDDLRHPRPGRGDDDGRPRGRDPRRRPPADRRAAGGLRPARRTCSSRASSAARR